MTSSHAFFLRLALATCNCSKFWWVHCIILIVLCCDKPSNNSITLVLVFMTPNWKTNLYSVLYYSTFTVVSLLFLGKINFLFFTATVPLFSCYFLYSMTLQQQYINSYDLKPLKGNNELINWVSDNLIPSIIGDKNTAVFKGNRLIWWIPLTLKNSWN